MEHEQRSSHDEDNSPTSATALRSALAQLLQNSGAGLKSGQAELLVDALLSHSAASEEHDNSSEDGSSSNEATLLEADMETALDDDSEDLPLGVALPTAMSAQHVAHLSPRSEPGIVLTDHQSAEQGAASVSQGGNLHSPRITLSLAARLGSEVSDLLHEEEWLDRHPGVAGVMDSNPELIDIMTELIKERQSLQHALSVTQHEMRRRKRVELEHAEYLEELSAEQIEKAKKELAAARQAELLQNIAVEINPDDVADHMARQLHEKEMQMQRLLEQQGELKQRLASKEEQHSERLRQFEDGQKKLLLEVDTLKSQLADSKCRSLKRRKRFGGETASRPSSMLLEQLSTLANEKEDEADKLRKELLDLQRRQQDWADEEQHQNSSALQTRGRGAERLDRSQRGSALFDYGLDVRDFEYSSERSETGTLPLQRGRSALLRERPSLVEGSIEAVARFKSSLPSDQPDVSLTAAMGDRAKSRSPSPLSFDHPHRISTEDAHHSTGVRRASDEAFSQEHRQPEASRAALTTTQLVNLRRSPKPGSSASNLIPVDTVTLECGSDFNDADSPSPNGSFAAEDRSSAGPSVAPASPQLSYQAAKQRHKPSMPREAANKSTGKHSPGDGVEAAVAPAAAAASAAGKVNQARLMHMLSLSYPEPLEAVKVYRSKSCPKLESIVEKDSVESTDGADPLFTASSSNALAIQPLNAGENAALSVPRKQYALNSDSDSDDEATRKFRSHSYGGRGESSGAQMAISAAVSRINWLPVRSSSSAFMSSTPTPTPTLGVNLTPTCARREQARVTDTEVHFFNVAVVGPSGVGKTSFVRSFGMGDKAHVADFKPLSTTIGMDFVVCTSHMCGVDVTLKVWDTAGTERFRSLASGYLRRCDGILLMFDVGDRSSFAGVKSWYDEVRDICREDVIVLILGNKIDVENRADNSQAVTMQDAIALAQELNSAMYLEVSATETYGVSESCAIITTAMLGKQLEQQQRLECDNKKIILGTAEEDAESKCCW